MAYGLDDAIDSITEHPYIAAGGVVILLFLMMRGGGSSAPAGQDLTASLQSMQIASDTNVALASIQAQRDAIALEAKRDIILGAQQYAQSDRAANVAIATQALTSSSNTAALVNSNAVQVFQSALGFTAAFKDLQNQSDSLAYNYSLNGRALINQANGDVYNYSLGNQALSNERIANQNQFDLGQLGIISDRLINMSNISSARDLSIAGINANLDLNKYAISTELDLEKYLAPFTERMNAANNATTEQLAHVAYKTAKVTSKPGLFASIMGGISAVLGTAGGVASQFIKV